MQLAALKHRTESEDCFVISPHHVRIRFHSAKNDVAKVVAHYTDNYLDTKTDKKADLKLLGHGQVSDHWGITLKAPYRRLKYTFEVIGKDGSHVIVGDRGISSFNSQNLNADSSYFKLPYLHTIDMTTVPQWVKQTVWYQIFPERFANGDTNNDPQGTKKWQPSDHPGREDYYGGDLQGIIDHLDYLQELGVTGLYLCPIFKASSNHKYDTIDYLEIDPAFGDKQLFAELVEQAHKRGMRVMLDAVFNHLGSQSLQWQDVVKNGAKSKFADWFHINQFPVNPNQTGQKAMPNYDTFAFEPSMPKLNTANPAVQDFLLEIATYWVKYFDIDAWRLDVANEVDHHFWRRFHAALIAIKPDFYIVGEIWHSARPWLNGDEFTAVMNYPYTLQIEEHFFKKTKTAQALVAALTDQLMLYRDSTNQAMMNMLDSHDTARILTLAQGDQELALQALTFMFMQTGSPCIYYGTEMGMTGGNDPDCRKPMDWSKKNSAVWQQVQQLIAFRKKYADTLGQGEISLTVTATDLIKVVRTKDVKITAYFNTTTKNVALTGQAILQQNFANGLLKPKGIAIEVE
ncbi:glycoside hydrolase family 13 protein [Lactobacillus sp.]|uniref:glycoside hydrolase family 13 protein n=1 Tax=Lactobacillus sp. TaxID=1591 RepID=UPI0025D43E46|nr:glycoside hydrolase family 13 protein [Lactobacillus sp.]MCO6536098.1 alpha-glycosidase [Lactobacillus sp.]